MKLQNVRLVGKLQNESFTKKDGTVMTNASALFQENNANYSKPFKVQFYGKSMDVIEGMIVNNDYDLSCNIESIQSGERYFTKVTCYAATQINQSQHVAQVSQPMAQPSTIFVGGGDDQNDMPF